MKTLIVGDTHTEPGEDLRRFKVLSEFIVHKQPESIVFIGDHLTLDSLSTYDLNRPRKVENRRLQAEIETGRDSIDMVEWGMERLRSAQRQSKQKMYNPIKIFLMGNHEDRFERYLDHHPELENVIDLPDLIHLTKYGWDVIPYREYAYLENTAFTHVPMNGLNKPLGGVSMAMNAVKGHSTNIVYGHSHRLNLSSFARRGREGEQVFAYNCGCFFEGVPSYARGSSGPLDWWRGVSILDHDINGLFDIQTFKMERMFEEYL